MGKHLPVLPDDLQQVLDLIEKGKLFAVQEWVKSGKRLRVADDVDSEVHTLCVAVRTGFHSMVEELLRAGPWPAEELAEAMELARDRHRYDIADLLTSHGAKPKELDFTTACCELDLATMERHLRAGTDPNHDNAFAQALCTVKARPLLGFYRTFRAEFPALDDQAALALTEAVKNNQVRWTALLAWAGADPFRPVPSELEGTFPVDPDDHTTAASQAIWRSNPEILKVLHLKPTPAQALDLLCDVAYHPNVQLFRTFLSAVPAGQINNTPQDSCAVLEKLVARWAHRSLSGNMQDNQGDAEILQCVEILLDAGARWNPPLEDLRSTRRSIMEHETRYIVQLLRLLLYTPNAVNLKAFLELCRSQTLEAKIASVNMPLADDLKKLRKETASQSVPVQ